MNRWQLHPVRLALAVALGAATNYLALRWAGRRQAGASAGPGGAFLLQVGGASLVMGLAGRGIERTLLSGDAVMASGFLGGVATLGAVGLLAALYFLVATALGVPEAGWLRRALGGRRAP